MIPPFDEHGMLPAGIHDCTLIEAQHVLCFNDRRVALWAGLIDLLCDLRDKDLAYPIFLAGGFVSVKPLPGDIDLVHDLRNACGYNQFQAAQLFKQREAIKIRYGVDYLPNLPENNDFSAYFQYIGPKASAATGLDEKYPRGILSIWSTAWRYGLTK